MYKITNIDSIGTEYSVADKSGEILQSVQLIPQDELLLTAIGAWEEGTSINEYLEKSIALLEGFEEIEPYTTGWYMYAGMLDISEAVIHAVKHGYTRLIIEQLE